MSIKKRILCILQLCLGLIALLWILLYPFLGSIYHYKSQFQILDSVLEHNEFVDLPKNEQKYLHTKYATLKAYSSQTKWDEAQKLFAEISAFEISWVLLAIILPILLLLRVEGANQLIWLLPIVCSLFVFENIKNGKTLVSIIPNEAYLVEKYVKEPLSNSINRQFEQFKDAWSDYLITEFSKENISQDPLVYEKQRNKGQFLFNVKKIKEIPLIPLSFPFQEKRLNLVLACYLLWNFLFAFFGRQNQDRILLNN